LTSCSLYALFLCPLHIVISLSSTLFSALLSPLFSILCSLLSPFCSIAVQYISMLLNLYYALRCEAWVCTLASNSCCIMDELRATVGGKANRYYTDLSVGSCARPPCLDGNDGGRNFGE
jgi:hypothetical protein